MKYIVVILTALVICLSYTEAIRLDAYLKIREDDEDAEPKKQEAGAAEQKDEKKEVAKEKKDKKTDEKAKAAETNDEDDDPLKSVLPPVIKEEKAEILEKFDAQQKAAEEANKDPKEKEKEKLEKEEKEKDEKAADAREAKDAELQKKIESGALTQFDADLLTWHNKMRTDPKSFIPELEAFNKTFNGR